jgi:hypothetical protein
MGNLPPICHGWREQAQRRASLGLDDKTPNLTRYGGWGSGGIDFQDHPSWADGLNVKRVPSGIHKGRVMFTSRKEAQQLAKMKSDILRRDVRYDP